MQYKAENKSYPLNGVAGEIPRTVALYREGKSWLAVFPGIPFNRDPKVLLGFAAQDGHVGVDVKYAHKLKHLGSDEQENALRTLNQIGYTDLVVKGPRMVQGKEKEVSIRRETHDLVGYALQRLKNRVKPVSGKKKLSNDAEKRFINGYFAAMIWTEQEMLREDDDFDFDGIEQLAPSALESSVNDCIAFMKICVGALHDVINNHYTWDHAGHDFWLTRNHHGTGFWDRGLTHGKQLTDVAHTFPEVSVYLGDDGLLYLG